ncbi:phospholipid/cholesterol/gamma-HCH transport system substrate-binding protein [Halopolyspora algeriensis]|uniref:Phospholipid/cholesterol/gamma-HCH transport system substrate-binding protein n=1 Tax=Halopolyspora algeriensis TaxID=1500506 RepID=A0A368VX56_9ACTN|nr:MlaD family protein [Halopolyspora algeriensis]RCW46788.1 phospholipid/cholesterol/gamma-HCH transport system substrate-binding protein [Halopolyspora algeriensis]TQM39206.1 phospholipid/cholesterol/gamma-HCH transport system substrate-binding protein [Halopolyspora algeriensis]
MLSRKVRIQIAAFVAVALVGVSYAGARYAGLDRLFGPRGYVVTMQLADSGGIFSNAEVTYRGVPVGRVGNLRLTDNGVAVPLDIEPSAPPIPENVKAVVAQRSAVGEQYVDLRPQSTGGPYLDGESVIPQQATETPLPVEDLLTNLDALVKSVPKDALRTVVDELGKGFAGTGPDLQKILDTSSDFVAEAQQHLPQTRKLLEDGKTVLATQNEQGSAIRSFSEDLRLVSEQLKRSDGDLRAVIEQAPATARQLSGLLRETGPQLTNLVRNLTSTSEMLATKTDAIEQMMVTYPLVTAGAYTVTPGDGTAHFGLVVNTFDPMPCYYESTEKRAGNELAPVPLNTEAQCKVPPDSPTAVRGARNAPGR